MSKRKFKKCVAENNCGHIYDAMVKNCPKCDSKDYRIGFLQKKREICDRGRRDEKTASVD